MGDTIKLIIFAVLCVTAVIAVILLINNIRKSSVKKEMDELSVRYNAITTIPLAFKFNKAQSIAKRSDETKEKIEEYYSKYKEAQVSIDQLGALFDEAEEAFGDKKYGKASEALQSIRDNIDDVEDEVNKIDECLDKFSQKETEQRDYSAKLKEEYRDIKTVINEKANYLSIGYDGIQKKLEKCEDLFSQSEEYMYASDYEKAQDALEDISKSMEDIKRSCNAIPELVKDAKGVIPILFDETNRQYALARQRNAYLAHLDIDKRLDEVQKNLNGCIKSIMNCEIGGVKENLNQCKLDLDNILNGIEKENSCHDEAKKLSADISLVLSKNKTLYNYVETSFNKDKERYNLGDIERYLEDNKETYSKQHSRYTDSADKLSKNLKSSSEIKSNLEELLKDVSETNDKLVSYKQLIDKNTSDEERAKTQLVKLQVVLNEVEVKVKEYHLPAIAESYKEDLIAGRERVLRIKKLLQEIPLDINELNSTLDEAINYIFTFFNNVNNVVGMAIMVENAIVFGNKYRSTYQEVDRDLSRSEFSYLNGEYTKALTMAISCMEKLFPNSANEKILENS